MAHAQHQNELIRSLREQVHKAFLQIGEMEKLFHMELEHNKKELEAREQELHRKEEELKQKCQAVQSRIRSTIRLSLESHASNKADESDSFSDISIIGNIQSSLRDSAIQSIYRLLDTERIEHQPYKRLEAIKELQKKVLHAVTEPPTILTELFSKMNEFCLDNCRLTEQLANALETIEVFKSKHQDSMNQLKRFQLQEIRLKQDNQRLARQRTDLLAAVQSVTQRLKQAEDEVRKKNRDIEELKKASWPNNHKLGVLLGCSKCNKQKILEVPGSRLDESKMSTVSSMLIKMEKGMSLSPCGSLTKIPPLKNRSASKTAQPVEASRAVHQLNGTLSVFKKRDKKFETL